jgi:DNA polymerase III subunit delta'
MSNFYISEILYLTPFVEANKKNSLELSEIQELVLNYLKNKDQQQFAKKSNIQWYNSQLLNFKIELARDIIQETQYANWNQSGVRVLVLLNFETASLAAQNALLKLIEEPPNNTLIILPVVSDHRLLSTITSRCSLCQLADQGLNSPSSNTNNHVWPKDLAAAITLIKNYKDRETAKNFVKELLNQKNLSYKQKRALSQAYLDLQANLNVRLALEHCFFSLFQ